MRRTVSLLAGVALAASLTACSAVRGGTQPRAQRSGTLAATRPHHPSRPGTLTGSALKALLLGQSDMPGGFRPNPRWSADSGGTLYPPSSATATPSARACAQLTGAPWLPAAGLLPLSFAADGYHDVYNDEIDQMIAVYPQVAVGQAVMANLDRLFALCARFTATSNGQKMQMSLTRSAGPAGGDDSISGVLTSSAWQGGETLVAIRVGSAVVSVDYSSSAADMGAAAPTLALRLAARLSAVA